MTHRRCRLSFTIGIAVALLVPHATRADAVAATTPPAVGRFDPFARGTYSVDLTGHYVLPVNGPQRFFGGEVGFGYAKYDGVIIGADVQADAMSDPSEADGASFGVNLLARGRLFRLGDVTIFADATVGAAYSCVSQPRDGQHFDFREQLGLGLSLPLCDRMHLIGGAHFQHMSDGGIESPNPGYNGVQFYVGVTIPL